ncbi:ComF family protein [Rhodococcus sp. D2-41]|uniref:ComF family protein n=1 Tax=Speluncibacter jeojiensis TaxID=2710754 RepID=UPI00240F90CD|nr:ComF family protein [Rhodococcus sp. D2-41]MDG3008790.1 ComF family protein [Rhodococcus sp. D2-41]
MRALIDLVLPLECGGCRTPRTRWCRQCGEAVSGEPVGVHTRLDPGVPVWSLGPHDGPRRRAVIAAKEHGRRDLARPLGVALAGAVDMLRHWGELDPPQLAPLVLVPAPTRAGAARRRGGDPVTAMARAAAAALRPEPVTVAPLLRLGAGVRDSVGMSAARRRRNLAGRVRLCGGLRPSPASTVVLVDDVVTTGATACESLSALAAAGVRVHAVLTVTFAE